MTEETSVERGGRRRKAGKVGKERSCTISEGTGEVGDGEGGSGGFTKEFDGSVDGGLSYQNTPTSASSTASFASPTSPSIRRVSNNPKLTQTVCSQYKSSINQLLAMLDTTSPFFVR